MADQQDSTNSSGSGPTSMGQRMHDFLEHPYLQTLLSIVGGGLATVSDGRWLCLCCPWVSYALVRSNALRGVRQRTAVLVHVTLTFVATALLFVCGSFINAHRSPDLASTIKTALAEFFHNRPDLQPPPPADFKPKVAITPFEAKGQDATGFLYEAYATNIGDGVALHRRTTSGYYVEENTPEGEAHVFREVDASFNDSGADAPRPADMTPGTDAKTSVQVRVPHLDGEDGAGVRNGSLVVYLFEVDLYEDDKGRPFKSELCMISDSHHNKLYFCRGHNGVSQLSQ